MKKIFVICASAFMALSMSSVFAQNPEGKECKNACKTEQVCNKDGKCKDAKGDCKKVTDGKKCCKGKDGKKGPFGKNGKKYKKGCPDARMQGHKGDKRGNRKLMEGIELTENQKSQVAELRGKLRNDKSKLRGEFKLKNDALKEGFHNDMKKILTKEQIVTYDANLEKMKVRSAEKQARKEMRKAEKKVRREKGFSNDSTCCKRKGPAPKLMTESN